MSIPQRILVTDVGSTTTKALLFGKEDNTWRLLARGETATTVEAPDEDVMIGVSRSIRLLEERSNQSLFCAAGKELLPEITYLSTSSAGGGLQMVVCGQVSHISAESAERAALGGGAVLLQVFAADDGLTALERIECLRNLHPDMILIAGGVDGAEAGSFLIEMCDFIREAQPKAKFGYQYALPILYAGSEKAAELVNDLLGSSFALKMIDNLRPTFWQENLAPAREAIQEIFVEHVMSHAPGYAKLHQAVALPIIPTPMAVGIILLEYAKLRQKNILCVDIGGATTDVFSVIEQAYVRSVGANYGMSYSIGHVAASTGFANILRWLPKEINLTEEELQEQIGNKLIYPTTIPTLTAELRVEQAVAREALRLAFQDHQALAKIQIPKGLLDNLSTKHVKEITIRNFDVIIGSGGVLSNAPNRGEAALMLIDAFQPEGIVELLVDSVFMLPHLGIFSQVDLPGALDLLVREGLISLGTVLAPSGQPKNGSPAMTVIGQTNSGRQIRLQGNWGELLTIPLGQEETAQLQIFPQNGAKWPLTRLHCSVQGGICGLILDLRGRPLNPENWPQHAYQEQWLKNISI